MITHIEIEMISHEEEPIAREQATMIRGVARSRKGDHLLCQLNETVAIEHEFASRLRLQARRGE